MELPRIGASRPRRGIVAVSAAAALGLGLAGLANFSPALAAAGCKVDYRVTNEWPGGFGATVTVTNLGDPLSGWKLEWDFPTTTQTVSQGWNGDFAQSGRHVTVTSLSWNASVGTNGTVQPGFNGAWSGSNPPPTAFTLNGTTCTGTVPTTPPPTTPPPTTPPPGSRADNPYDGAKAYINPDYAATVTAAATAKGGALGAAMAKVAQYPTAVWLDRIAAVTGGSGVTRNLAGHLDAALAQQSGSTPVVITLVVYDLPNRDCAAYASNGELLISQDGLNKYKTLYIDPLASVLSNAKYADLRVVAIIEPDSIPNLVTNLSTPACAEANSSGAYVQGTQYAINKLHAIPNVYQYLDIAHSGWLGWDSNFQPAVNLITNTVKGTTAGVNSVQGFISNTANYTPVEETFLPDPNLNVGGQQVRSSTYYEWNPYFDERDYDTAMRTAFINAGFPSSIGMLLDTSRNGWGGSGRPTAVSTSTDLNTYVNQSRIDRRLHRGNWCNQPSGIGARPVANPLPGFDAYVWIKPPGESDGVSQAGVPDPSDPNKKFDTMCDPNAQSRYNPNFRTGAMPGAPHAGQWYEFGFETLVQNAYPAL